jgi:type I restriction enzyme, R subunit
MDHNSYIRAEESEKISAFDDTSLIQIIVEQGIDVINSLPKGIRENSDIIAETIENNIRKLIINDQQLNPKYYENMSELLNSLIEKRKQQAIEYQEYLEKIVDLTNKIKDPLKSKNYPEKIDTSAKRALYDNLNNNEELS